MIYNKTEESTDFPSKAWPMHSFLHDHHSPCAACSVIKSCLTLCKCMDCSLPGSSVLGTFPKKTRILRGLPFSTLGDLPNWSVETVLLVSPALAGVFFTTGPPAKLTHHNGTLKNKTNKQTDKNKDEPSLTHHNHLRFTVYLSVHSWHCMNLDKGIMPYPSLSKCIIVYPSWSIRVFILP